MPWLIQGGVENSHHRIPDIFIHHPAVGLHSGLLGCQGKVHNVGHLLRWQGFGQRGKASHVREQEGGIAFLPAQHQQLGMLL